MKRIFIATLIVFVSCSHLSATNYYQSLRSYISSYGQAIENVDNVPMIGKLTNLLPMALLAAGLKECPIQTMMVLMAMGTYTLLRNEMVQEIMDKYEIMNNMPWKKRNSFDEQQIDENIFVFDDEDELVKDDVPHNALFDNKTDDVKQRQEVQREFL